MRLTLTLASILALLAAACSPYDPELGEAPFRCGTEEPLCPDGYACFDSSESPTGVCRKSGDGEPRVDGGSAGSCTGADLEPNDDTSTAVVTQIPDSSTQYSGSDLEVCPAGDVDLYRLRVDIAAQNIIATVTNNRDQGVLALQILNGSGTPVTVGSYTNSTTLTATLNNAATGTWYVEVSGADGSVENGYSLAIQLTGP